MRTRDDDTALPPTDRVLHAAPGPWLFPISLLVLVLSFGTVMCVVAGALFPLVFWFVGGCGMLAATVAQALVLRGDRVHLDRAAISLCAGPPAIGRWESVPWYQVTVIEDIGKGVRVYTGTGWYEARLGRHPIIVADDYFPTILRWWQAYGYPPPPTRYP
jgi:hypothetical protein